MFYTRIEQTGWDFLNNRNIDIDTKFESFIKILTENLGIYFPV